MTWAVTNHLWQSTLFAIAAGLLTLVFRKGRARVRYGLWFSASCKFFIPFSLLTALGNHIGWMPAARTPAVPYVLFKVDQITQPFPEALRSTPSGPGTATDWLFVVIITAWICGFSAIVVARFRDWLHLRFPELESKAGNYGVWGGLVPGFADASARQVFGAYHGKTFTGKLRPLIAVEDFRPTLSQCLPQGLQAEIQLHRQRQPPAQHEPAEPIHDRHQIDKTLGHRDVGDVRAPDLIASRRG